MAEFIGLADRDRRRGTIYPSPFFDIAQTYMPPTVKELFRWCSYFFYKDPMIGSIVTKLAEYPVTDFIYNATDKHVRDGWKKIIEDVLNMKPFLIEIGLDFGAFGNAFVSLNLPFVRWLKCDKCEHLHRLSDKTFEYKFSNFEFKFQCQSCKDQATGKIEDRPVRDAKGINFVRWAPINIDINYNPITGKSRYRYKIPGKVRKAIQEGDRDILIDVPAVFIEALKKKRDIELSDQNLFHFKRPTLAEQDMGWGKPLIIHSMSRMFYLYVLRRAQEAIALQRILPLEFIFPQANAAADPYQHVNLASWTATVQDEIRKWRQDCVSPATLIQTPRGLRRADELVIGDEVINHAGRTTKIIASERRSIRDGERAYRVMARGLPAVDSVFSEHHPILGARSFNRGNGHKLGQPAFIEAGDLRVGDYVACPVAKRSVETQSIDLATYTERYATKEWLYRDYFSREVPETFEEFEQHGVSSDRKGAMERLGVSLNQYMTAAKAFRDGTGMVRVSRHVPLDEEFAWVLGLYAAEGNVNNAQILFALHKDEKGFEQRLAKFFEHRFGARHFVASRSEHGMQVCFNSKVAAELFSGLCPGTSRTKHVPDVIKHERRDSLVLAFLRGLLDGDGCWHNDGVSTKVTLHTVSRQLAEDVRGLLFSLHVPCGIGRSAAAPYNIVGRVGMSAETYCLTVHAGHERLLALFSGKDVPMSWCAMGEFRDGYFWHRIRTIEQVSVEEVIGFQTEAGDDGVVVGEDRELHGTFCTWGMATANCNYISVVSVPLGFERLGGDGRALLLGPEIDVTNKEIAAGMGAPIELAFGGMQFSGSSVSLRMLENHFLMYRRLLLRFVSWTKDRLRLYLNLPDVDIGFTEFKMADDVQRKQLVIQLNAASKISDHTMLTELGFDYDEEQKSIEKETESRNRIMGMQMKAQAESQGESSIVQAKYQARAQEAFQEASGQVPQLQPGQAAPPGQEQGGQQDPNAIAADQQMAQQAAAGQAGQVQSAQPGEAGVQGGQNVLELDATRVAKNWANKISTLPEAQRQQVLAELNQKMPNMYRMVMQLLSQIPPGGTAGDARDNMRPLPQAKPPTRDKGVM